MRGQVLKADYVSTELSRNPVEFVEQRLYIQQLLLLYISSFKHLKGWAERGGIAALVIQVRTPRIRFRVTWLPFNIEEVFLFFILIDLITQVGNRFARSRILFL